MKLYCTVTTNTISIFKKVLVRAISFSRKKVFHAKKQRIKAKKQSFSLKEVFYVKKQRIKGKEAELQ